MSTAILLYGLWLYVFKTVFGRKDLITIASTPDFKDIINRNGIRQVAEIVSRLISFYESHPSPSFGLNVFIMMYLQSLLNNNLDTHDNEQEEALD